MFEMLHQNLASPPILFFVLGILAGILKSDLEVPKSIGRFLSLYLMIAIGLKGGVAISETSVFDPQVGLILLSGVLLGFMQPFLGYFLLKVTTSLDKATRAAVASHYGSISMITFVAASSFLKANDVSYAGYIVAALAMMEAPAIFSGLYLAKTKRENSNELFREVFTGGAVFLLFGSFVIGWLQGPVGMQKMAPLFVEPFQGMLSLFLLDMGLLVSRQLSHLKAFSPGLILFGIYMPLIGAFAGAMISVALNLEIGTATLFTCLAASASYIAVPAAMRVQLPEAKAGVYLPMALAITFPFNLLIGIPAYFGLMKFLLKS